jgi:hypothetical protein
MRTLKTALLSLGLAAAISSAASAQIVGFDNVTSAPIGMIGNGYAGFNWDNAFVIDPVSWFGSTGAAAGFGSALQSSAYVMGNGGGNAMTISGNQFNLLGGTFASAWRKGMTVSAIGSLGGAQKYSRTFLVDWDKSQYVGLNMFGVDNIVFTTSGGTVEGFDSHSNASFAVDNLVFEADGGLGTLGDIGIQVVPEPMTVSLMGFGLLAVGLAAKRRRSSK